MLVAGGRALGICELVVCFLQHIPCPSNLGFRTSVGTREANALPGYA